VFGIIYDIGDAAAPILAGLLVAALLRADVSADGSDGNRNRRGFLCTFGDRGRETQVTVSYRRSTAMRNVIVLPMVLLMSLVLHRQMRKMDFEQDTVGHPPRGLLFGESWRRKPAIAFASTSTTSRCGGAPKV
jgi:hypothetical protein